MIWKDYQAYLNDKIIFDQSTDHGECHTIIEKQFDLQNNVLKIISPRHSDISCDFLMIKGTVITPCFPSTLQERNSFVTLDSYGQPYTTEITEEGKRFFTASHDNLQILHSYIKPLKDYNDTVNPINEQSLHSEDNYRFIMTKDEIILNHVNDFSWFDQDKIEACITFDGFDSDSQLINIVYGDKYDGYYLQTSFKSEYDSLSIGIWNGIKFKEYNKDEKKVIFEHSKEANFFVCHVPIPDGDYLMPFTPDSIYLYEILSLFLKVKDRKYEIYVLLSKVVGFYFKIK